MLRFFGNRKVLCDGLTRRDLLHIGGLGAFGVALSDLFGLPEAQRQSGGSRAEVRSGQVVHPDLQVRLAAAARDVRPQAGRARRNPGRDEGDSAPACRASTSASICRKIARIMDRLTVVRSLTHPYPLHGTVYATTGIPDVDTKIEAQPRHKRQWPFIGSIVDYFDDRRAGGTLPEHAAQHRPAVRDGLEERIPAAGRPVRRACWACATIRSTPTSPPKGRRSRPRFGPARRSTIRCSASARPTSSQLGGGAATQDVAGRAARACGGRCSPSSTAPAATSTRTSGSALTRSSSRWPFRC